MNCVREPPAPNEPRAGRLPEMTASFRSYWKGAALAFVLFVVCTFSMAALAFLFHATALAVVAAFAMALAASAALGLTAAGLVVIGRERRFLRGEPDLFLALNDARSERTFVGPASCARRSLAPGTEQSAARPRVSRRRHRASAIVARNSGFARCERQPGQASFHGRNGQVLWAAGSRVPLHRQDLRLWTLEAHAAHRLVARTGTT